MKARVLPAGPRPRRLPFGIAKGIVMDIDFESQTIFYLGLYEVELSRYFREICKPGLICWDIGASVGYDSLLLAKLTGASVIAFEPDPGGIEKFQKNMEANGRLAAKVDLVPRFVSSTPSDSAVSIDSYASQPGTTPPDVLKIDVEGAEMDVLRGGQSTIESHHPSIILEVHSLALEEECQRFLRDHGYAPRIVSRRKWLKESRPIPHNRWLIAATP